MCSASGSVSHGARRTGFLSYWLLPIAGLVAVWLWLAFSSGGSRASQYLPAALVLGLFALVASLAGAYPRVPGQLSLALLGLLAAYAIWVALSALWAESTYRVWMETARTLTYLLFFALALVYFTDPVARRAFRYLIVVAALALAAACIVKLWTTSDVAQMFQSKRFSYPVTASNHAGSLLLIMFWPLMWLASGSSERSPVRGLALGVATSLLGLAVMTQSRGAVWSLVLSGLLMFVITPSRLRLLLYLVVPALLMVYEFPTLNRYWLEGPETVGGAVGARTLLVATVIAGFIGMILALLERWVRVSVRMKTIFGTFVVAAVLAGLVFWVVTATDNQGGPVKWASQAWHQFSAAEQPSQSPEQASRFSIISSTGRVQIWKVAVRAFKSAPVLGVGADNFAFQLARLRTSESYKAQHAHSIELQVFGETGIVGGVLFSGGILLALGGCLWPRYAAGWWGARDARSRRKKKTEAETPNTTGFRRSRRWGSDPKEYAWEIALLGGAAYWLIHASVDWIWQMPGVTMGAFLLLAAAVASIDARAGVLWPRLRRWLSLGASGTLNETGPDTPESQRAHTHRAHRLLDPVFRALIVTLSAVLLLVAGLPYLSLQFQNSALTLANTDGVRAIARAGAARHLVPADPGPYLTQAKVYEQAASRALEQEGTAAAGAVFDNLSLAVASYQDALSVESADWTVHLHEGIALLNLMIARSYVEGWTGGADQTGAELLGLRDWSILGESPSKPASVGLTPGSLARDASARERAAGVRDLTPAELADATLECLAEAKERNPLASQVDAALRALVALNPPGS